MPLFGLLPYDDEEKRRRRLPTEEDDYAPPPPALPEISGRRPALSAAGNADAITPPTFPTRRPSRFQEMNEAKDVYMQKTPGRLKAGLLGGLQAIGGGGGQDFGQTVGQGLGGLIGGLINPRGVREQQFNQRVRPQIMERFGAEDQERAAARQAEQDALNTDLKRAQIGATNRQNLPAPPRPVTVAPGSRLVDPATGQPIYESPAAPKEKTQRPITFEGRTYDLNDPASRAQLDAAQAKIPRDKFGRAISRADERTSARGGGSRGGRDVKARDKAVAEFNNARQGLIDAVSRGDEDVAFDLRDRLNKMVTDITARYGDQIEAGGGEWPYIKQRGQQSAPKQSGQRTGSKNDPLGIR